MSSFDPKDPKYQVSKEFAPDKADTWEIGMGEDAWVIGHRAIRGEIKQILEALEEVSERATHTEWERNSVKTLWEVHSENTKAHHDTEEDYLFPLLKERFVAPEKVSSDHKKIVESIEKLNTMIQAYSDAKETDEASNKLKEIIPSLKEYQSLLLEHLQEEEDTTLILCRAYFTQKEIGNYMRESMSNSSKQEVGSFVHYAYDTPEEFRTNFMAKRGIPSFVWYMKFGPAHGAFCQAFLRHVMALQQNTPPESLDDSSCCIS